MQESSAGSARKPPPLIRKGSAASSLTDSRLGMDDDLIGGFARRSLAAAGIDPDAFVWQVPCETILLRSGKFLEGGVLAADPIGRLHIFRYTPKDGFQLASMELQTACASVGLKNGALHLQVSLPDQGAVQSCTCILDGNGLARCRGSWLPCWQPRIIEATGEDLIELHVAEVEIRKSLRNAIGSSQEPGGGLMLLGVGATGIRLVASADTIAFADVLRWRRSGDRIHCLSLANGQPILTSIREAGVANTLTRLEQVFPENAKADFDIAPRFESTGCFDPVGQSNAGPVILEILDDTVLVVAAQGQTQFRQAYTCVDRTVLVADNGECMCIRTLGDAGKSICERIAPLTRPIAASGGTSWMPLLSADNARHIRRMEIQSGSATCEGTEYPYPISSITVLEESPGVCRATLGNADSECGLLGPETLIYALWAEWDSRKTATGLAKAGIADLYSQFNAAKRHNFLLLLFGDIVMLNRSLDAGTTMDDLVRRINELGAVQFAENNDLRNATVSKILLMISSLPAIKQKFEVLATMGPYHWAHQEVEWVSKAFGNAVGQSASLSERKRIVPLVRRQVRAVQGDLLRSLAQIEAAARPIESILAKDELEKHWSSKVRKVLPLAVQGTIGVTMMALSGGTQGWQYVGGALATSTLGNVLGFFQKDREAAAQVQHAAETIFPWWQIFIKTLVVSIFESAEFVDGENERAMKRDREMLNAVPAEKRAATLGKLQAELRRRIVNERKNRFAEVLAGSGIRYQNLLDDLDNAAEKGIRESINEFNAGLITSGDQNDGSN